MQMKYHELQPMVKGRGTKTFKKWLDELITSLSERAVAEIGISYSGSDDWAKEMKESLQAYVESQFLFWKRVPLFKLTRVRTLGYFDTLPP